MPQDADVADFTRIFPSLTLSRDAVAYVCVANIAVTDWSGCLRICRVGASAPIMADPCQGCGVETPQPSALKNAVLQIYKSAHNPLHPRPEAVFWQSKIHRIRDALQSKNNPGLSV